MEKPMDSMLDNMIVVIRIKSSSRWTKGCALRELNMIRVHFITDAGRNTVQND
jgi:hypothetical protein